MTKERMSELRAGIFTIITLISFGAISFILGTQKGYFKPQITLRTSFTNVYGLQVGSPVRFMGVRIGQVKDIVLPGKLPCTGIDVLLQIYKSAQKNITKDSVATIKWLSYVTGDSYVEITMGACLEPEVKDGDSIKSAEPTNYAAILETGIGIVDSLSKTFKKFEKSNIIESIGSVTASLNENLNNFQKSEGLLHSLVYNPKGKQLLDNLVKTSESLKNITSEIENGEGTIGALIADPSLYDNMKKLLGGAERSLILRHLIRRSIEKGKKEEPPIEQ